METKICTKCSVPQDLENFAFLNVKTNRRKYVCKECDKKVRRAYYLANTEKVKKKCRAQNTLSRNTNGQYVWDYLKVHPCKCGETDPVALDFDHRNREEKFMEVSQMIHIGYNLEKIKEEILKCDVLCANCHRKRTAIQMGWYKYIIR